jgi:hypothetical protein
VIYDATKKDKATSLNWDETQTGNPVILDVEVPINDIPKSSL